MISNLLFNMCIKNNFIKLLTLILLMSSCEEKFHPKINDNLSLLVVDGKITNGIGSCEVRLFRTDKLTEKFELHPEIDATVILHDDQDRTEILTEHEPGIYRNSTLTVTGIVGSSYWIEIQTFTGEKYESTPELMNSAFEISSVYGEELKIRADNNSKEEAVGIYFNTKNRDNTSNYLKWEYRESYEWHSLYTHKEIVTESPSNICYPVNNYSLINVYDASNMENKEVNHLSASQIFKHEVKLKYNYLLDLKLYSISKENYVFWKNMKSIHQSNGNLYDILPANVSGNIYSCEENLKVLGYFEVSSVRTQKNIFSRNNFSIDFNDSPIECEKFTLISESPPDRTRYHILKKTPINRDEDAYLVRNLSCYECNSKYPDKKPSFWP